MMRMSLLAILVTTSMSVAAQQQPPREWIDPGTAAPIWLNHLQFSRGAI